MTIIKKSKFSLKITCSLTKCYNNQIYIKNYEYFTIIVMYIHGIYI